MVNFPEGTPPSRDFIDPGDRISAIAVWCRDKHVRPDPDHWKLLVGSENVSGMNQMSIGWDFSPLKNAHRSLVHGKTNGNIPCDSEKQKMHRKSYKIYIGPSTSLVSDMGEGIGRWAPDPMVSSVSTAGSNTVGLKDLLRKVLATGNGGSNPKAKIHID